MLKAGRLQRIVCGTSAREFEATSSSQTRIGVSEMNPNPPLSEEPLGDGLLSAQEVRDLTVEEMEESMRGLSREDLALLEEQFLSVDRDSSGTIDAVELHSYLSRKWRRKLPQQLISNIVKYADVDEDGRVDFREFIRLQLKCLPKFRGYCQSCSKVILGLDGWFCPSCDPYHRMGMKKSFALCLSCYSKSDKIPHEHPYDQFVRFKISTMGSDGVQQLVKKSSWIDDVIFMFEDMMECMFHVHSRRKKSAFRSKKQH